MPDHTLYLKFLSHAPTLPTLVAVSGGLDSITLAELYHLAGIELGVAHCNFGLRGEESEGDAASVEAFAKQRGIPFYTVQFETEKRAHERGESIQVVARDLRYEWLETMRTKHGYTHLATAHHADDNLETVLINLARGSSLQGLAGIPSANGHIVRPLLAANVTREEVHAFALERGLVWREDSSNATDKYTRNLLRHEVVPILRRINPHVAQTVGLHSTYLREAAALYRFAIDTLRAKYVAVQTDGTTHINTNALSTETAATTLLYEWLQPLGFTASQARNILSVQENGRVFSSPIAHALWHGGTLRITHATTKTTNEAPLESIQTLKEGKNRLNDGSTIQLEQTNELPTAADFTNTHIIYVDTERLALPLTVRHWQHADRFTPFGKRNTKLVSDEFTERKLSLDAKARVWLLVDANGTIIWVVGIRPADGFRVTPNTHTLLKIVWEAGG